MVVGREAERRELALLLAQARAGRAGVAALVGDPGVGKSALLEAAVGLADGFSLLRAVGVPAESTIGYAAVATLLAPLADNVAALPERQRRAVNGCLARDAGGSEAGDLLALGWGVLTLLAESSQRRPVFAVVDDLQWADDESRRVLGFVARRLGGEHVALMLAARSSADLPYGIERSHVLGELCVAHSRALLRERHPDLHPDVVQQLEARCGGNPLALVETAASLDELQRRGVAPLRDDPHIPATIRAAYAARLNQLTDRARRVLLLAACEGRGDLAVLALAAARVDASVADLDSVVAEDLLTVDHGQVRLRHPLLTACVLDEAGPAARRAAHAALADALTGTDDDRAVWHRAGASSGPDDSVVAALEEVAARAGSRGTPAMAGRALEQAAALTLSRPRRVELLVGAAESALQAGSGARAQALLTDALAAGAAAAAVQARIWIVEGRLALLRGRAEPAARLLVAAAPHLPGPVRVAVLIDALRATLELGDHALAARALGLLDPSHESDRPADLHVRVARAMVGYSAADPEADQLVPDDLRMLGLVVESDLAAPATLALLGELAIERGRLMEGRALFVRAADAAREHGDVPALADATLGVAFAEHMLGRWNSAHARLTEVLALVDEGFAPALVAEALTLTAEIHSVRGHDEPCRSTCQRLRTLADDLDDPQLRVLADRREGVLHFGAQRLDQAILCLETALAAATAAGITHPYVSPVPDLVEAYLRQRRPDDAARVAEPFISGIGPGSPPPARARGLRVRGLLASSEEYDEELDQSVELDEAIGMRFHAARTLLCHAERLRRDRRRVDARARLLRALDVFRGLDATPWIARAEAELAACGGTVRPSTAGTPSELLTPQELQIAVLVMEGQRNREIAAALFLSVKTVEFHLSGAYRKLRVSSRTQLAARMSA